MKTCPNCGGTRLHKHSRTPAGSQRYRCYDCSKIVTDSAMKQGGQPIGDRPMTGAERQRRWREKHKKKSQKSA